MKNIRYFLMAILACCYISENNTEPKQAQDKDFIINTLLPALQSENYSMLRNLTDKDVLCQHLDLLIDARCILLLMDRLKTKNIPEAVSTHRKNKIAPLISKACEFEHDSNVYEGLWGLHSETKKVLDNTIKERVAECIKEFSYKEPQPK